MNCDGWLNGLEIDPLVLVRTGQLEYRGQYPGRNVWLADSNRDGWIDDLDIEPFGDLLTGG